MLKIKPKNIKIAISFVNLMLLVLIIFDNKINAAYGSNNSWIEISRTSSGIQYLDSDSLINKDVGKIEITTKYLKIDTSNSKDIEENIYVMRINCITNKYKDISVNGERILISKWEDPNEDKLINDVISDSCKNAQN